MYHTSAVVPEYGRELLENMCTKGLIRGRKNSEVVGLTNFLDVVFRTFNQRPSLIVEFFGKPIGDDYKKERLRFIELSSSNSLFLYNSIAAKLSINGLTLIDNEQATNMIINKIDKDRQIQKWIFDKGRSI